MSLINTLQNLLGNVFLPCSHQVPCQPLVQVHVPGEVHVPLLLQGGEQIAETEGSVMKCQSLPAKVAI